MDDLLELFFNGQQYKKLKEALYRPLVKKYGLSMLDILVLVFLNDHEDFDTAKDIAALQYLTKSHVSKEVDVLIGKGYLKTKKDDRDKRCIHLELQDKAIPVIESVKDKQTQLIHILFNGIDEEDKKAIRRIAAKISSNMAHELK